MRRFARLINEAVHKAGKDIKTADEKAIYALREALALLEACMRRCTLSSHWHSSLGYIAWHPLSVEGKEARKKEEKRRKEEASELAKADPEEETDEIVWVKYGIQVPRHQLWKMRDEQYRMNSYGDYGGWMFWRYGRPYKQSEYNAEELKHRRQRVDAIGNKLRTELEEAIEAEVMTSKEFSRQMHSVLQKQNALKQVRLKCYSSLCRMNKRSVPICGVDSPDQQCYRQG